MLNGVTTKKKGRKKNFKKPFKSFLDLPISAIFLVDGSLFI